MEGGRYRSRSRGRRLQGPRQAPRGLEDLETPIRHWDGEDGSNHYGKRLDTRIGHINHRGDLNLHWVEGFKLDAYDVNDPKGVLKAVDSAVN